MSDMCGENHTPSGSVVDEVFVELQQISESEMQDALNQYVRDLTATAREGEFTPDIEYREQTDRALVVLNRKRLRNPVLIGNSSEACQAVVEGVAYRLMRGDAPERLIGKRIIEFDIDDTQIDEQYQRWIKAVLKRVIASNDQKILFLAPCPRLIVQQEYSLNPGEMGIGRMLWILLRFGIIQCIGVSDSPQAYSMLELKQPVFHHGFQEVYV